MKAAEARPPPGRAISSTGTPNGSVLCCSRQPPCARSSQARNSASAIDGLARTMPFFANLSNGCSGFCSARCQSRTATFCCLESFGFFDHASLPVRAPSGVPKRDPTPGSDAPHDPTSAGGASTLAWRGAQPAILLVRLAGLGVLSRPREWRPQRMRSCDYRVTSSPS